MFISLYDLGLVIIFIIILVVSGYLIAVLHRVFCVIGLVRGVLTANNADIRQTISELPTALANINELTVNLKETLDQTNNVFGSLQNNLTDTVDDLRCGAENFIIYAKVVAEVCRAVFSKSG